MAGKGLSRRTTSHDAVAAERHHLPHVVGLAGHRFLKQEVSPAIQDFEGYWRAILHGHGENNGFNAIVGEKFLVTAVATRDSETLTDRLNAFRNQISNCDDFCRAARSCKLQVSHVVGHHSGVATGSSSANARTVTLSGIFQMASAHADHGRKIHDDR